MTVVTTSRPTFAVLTHRTQHAWRRSIRVIIDRACWAISARHIASARVRAREAWDTRGTRTTVQVRLPSFTYIARRPTTACKVTRVTRSTRCRSIAVQVSPARYTVRARRHIRG